MQEARAYQTSQIGLSNPQCQSLMQMINLAKNAKNPAAVLQQMLEQNPNMQKAIQYVRENGGDPKAACYKMASENGLDLDTLLKGVL